MVTGTSTLWWSVSAGVAGFGMALLYLGLTLLLDSPWPLLLLPVVLLIVDRYVIRREERHLEARFGADFDAYRRRVRRWL